MKRYLSSLNDPRIATLDDVRKQIKLLKDKGFRFTKLGVVRPSDSPKFCIIDYNQLVNSQQTKQP